MVTKNLTLKDIDIISTISDSKKTTVKLVTFQETKQFAVLKQYPSMQALGCYEQTISLPTGYFPKIYGIWEENNSAFLLEEYISGTTLQEKLEENISLSETELTNIVKQICQALLVLHNANPPIIHRDVKPENIMITKDGNIKLLDFDAAREYKPEKNHDTILMGTKEYASPEQFGFMQTDTRSDIYSFGIVFSELLSHANVSPDYKSKAKKIIDKATMFDPGNRYTNTNQLLKDLSSLERNKKIGLQWFILAGCICLFIITLSLIKFNNRTILNNPSLTLNINEEIQSTIAEFLLTKIREQDTSEQKIVEPAPSEPETPKPVIDSSKEYLTLAEAYNYIDITDEVDPTAFYLMEDRGDLFGGIPTSGTPRGMYSMGQECIIGSDYVTCRFLKGYPRDLVFCDFRLKDVFEVSLYPYLKESETNGEKITLTANDYTQEYGDVVSISKDFLQTLEPGAYTLFLTANHNSYPLYLIIHGEEETVDKFYPRPINEIGYYSSNKQNDVVFYSTSTPYPIKEIRMNNSLLDPKNYTLVDNGFGVVFKPDFLEQYKNKDCIEMVYVTENDREGGIRIINISNFQ